MTLYLRDVVFWDRRAGDLRPGNLIVEAGPQGGLQVTTAPPSPDQTVVEGDGALALAGLTLGHHHAYSALARGMPPPARAPRDFAEILELVWWRLDRCLDAEMVRASALAAALDCLRCGVTRVIDHHASPQASAGSLDVIAEAFESLGLSYLLCYELSDRDGPQAAQAGLAETERYLGTGRPGLVGLHASFTVGEGLLGEAVALARRNDTGIHVHVAEDPVDQDRCLEEHGCRVVERLAAAGVLELPGSLLVHALHLSPAERELVDRSPAWLVHNPESNQNNAVGQFDWRGVDRSRVLVGTDGLHGDVLRSARAALLAGRASGLTPTDAWGLIENNDRYLERHHPSVLRANDVVLFDYRSPTPLEAGNLVAHACHGLDARHVRTVIAEGRVVLRDGEFVVGDEPAILRFCRDQASRLWTAFGESPPEGTS